jgi:hypothetical protein
VGRQLFPIGGSILFTFVFRELKDVKNLPRAYIRIRCSIPYFSEVIKSIFSSQQKILVTEMGFEEMLQFDD